MPANDNDNVSKNGAPNGNGAYYGENYYGAENDADKVNLSHIFYMLWGNKWIIIGIVIVFLVAAWAAAFVQTPIYQSQGSLMVKTNRNQPSYAGNSLGNLLSSFGVGIGISVADQIQVLKSRRLSYLVADTLMEAPLMQNGRQYPILFNDYPDDSTMATRGMVAHRLRQNLTFIQPNAQSHLIDVTDLSPSPMEAAAVVNMTIAKYNQLSTHQNRQSAGSAVDFLKKQRQKIHKELGTSEKKLEAYRHTHKVVQLDAQTQSLIHRTAQLEQSRQKARTLLVATNAGIKQYKQQLNEIKPGLADQYIDAMGASMNRLQYALAEAKTQRTEIYAKNPQLKKTADPPPQIRRLNQKIKLYKDSIKAHTKKMLSKGNAYLSVMGSSGGDITNNISQLNTKLIGLKANKQQYQSQVALLTKRINQLNARFNNLPENMITLAQLKRQAEINKELYVSIAKQQANMALWRQTQFSTGQLIDKGTVSHSPVKPNKKLYLFAGFILGGIIAIGFVFGKESFKTTIDGTKKLKDFGLPVLSVIPDISHIVKKEYKRKKTTNVKGKEISTGLVSFLKTISPAAEAFRRLESNILYANPDSPIKSLLVTSSKQNEGKSLVTSNLAVIMAEAGKNVLLIDTDLRRPQLHRIFGAERSPGITEVLFDKIPLDDAIQETVVPDLSLLTSGQKSPNPTVVKKSARFQELINRLKRYYDFVLLDSPPYGLISDTSYLLKPVQNVVMVCRFDETKKNELQHTLEELGNVDANVIGTVLNAYKVGEGSDYYLNQNYYYHYYKNYEAYES
jgi:capsular exopolysaccharide synthesis family protein